MIGQKDTLSKVSEIYGEQKSATSQIMKKNFELALEKSVYQAKDHIVADHVITDV